jgi:hypothetical protein
MGFWGSLTGSDQAEAAQNAARDTYLRQGNAIESLLGYGTEYANNLKGLSQNYAPFAQTGLQANDALSKLIANPSSVSSLPGYQFDLQQGQQALDRSAAARGIGQSGRAAKDALRFGTGLADKTYGDQLARLMALNQQGLQATGLQTGTEAQGLTGQLGARTTAYGGQMNQAGTLGQGQIAGANAEAAGAQNLLNTGAYLGGKIIGAGNPFSGLSSLFGGSTDVLSGGRPLGQGGIGRA